MYQHDNRTVITLDAGGTNFVFGAMQANDYIIEPITLPSLSENLDECLGQLVKGFEMVIAKIETKPVAISFAFPGPADYANGIIGGYLPNFPSFRDGVALGPFLESKFGVPVYINNDGDLFAYGEALAGKLVEINKKVEAMGCVKKFKSLIGYTFGTGFGVGHVYDSVLHLGDNSCIETFCLRNKFDSNLLCEEGVAVRAVKRVYADLSGDYSELEPKDIFDIAEGTREGDQAAAKKSFERMGQTAGDAMATAVSLLDGIVVIGGGITAAKDYIMPALLEEMRSTIYTVGGEEVRRVQPTVYNLDDEVEFRAFAKGKSHPIKVYGTDKYVNYDEEKRIGVAISTIGASKAISLGAYNYALSQIDKETAAKAAQ
ncbi:MAG: ROK family protein [Rikenellaceae bacterium]